MFVISLPVLGIVIGILQFNAPCLDDASGLGLHTWLTSFSLYLLCYEIFFFSDLPAYWSDLYARICRKKIRNAFYYIFTVTLFLWWCAGWYVYTIYDACQTDQLGTVALVVLLASMLEA